MTPTRSFRRSSTSGNGKALGIRETARRAGMGHMPARISEWELGYVSPSLKGLRRWAAGLGCDLALVTLPTAQPTSSLGQVGSNEEGT